MKIGLITIHYANSYGGVLQAFATQKTLSKYGEVSIIDYRTSHLESTMDLLRFGTSPRDVLRIGKDVFRLMPRYRLIKKFHQFFKNHYSLIGPYRSIGELSSIEKNFDIFVSGSDQIWNPEIVGDSCDSRSAYLLDFVTTKKKISYASSVGSYQFSSTEKQVLAQSLSTFNHVSVRERDTANMLTSLLNRPVAHIVDPTLLLTKYDWVSHFNLEKPKNSNPYILVYALKKDKLLKEIVADVAEKLNICVIAIDQDPFVNYKCNEHIRDASPKEFVSLFTNAHFIITNSFHGTTFSLNLNIPFIVTPPPTGINRIQSLLDATGTNKRFLNKKEKLSSLLTEELDFTKINETLARLRNQSKNFLDKAFSSQT